MDGQMDGWINGWMIDGYMDGWWMDKWMDKWIDWRGRAGVLLEMWEERGWNSAWGIGREWLAGNGSSLSCPGTSTEGMGAALAFPSSHGKRTDRSGGATWGENRWEQKIKEEGAEQRPQCDPVLGGDKLQAQPPCLWPALGTLFHIQQHEDLLEVTQDHQEPSPRAHTVGTLPSTLTADSSSPSPPYLTSGLQPALGWNYLGLLLHQLWPLLQIISGQGDWQGPWVSSPSSQNGRVVWGCYSKFPPWFMGREKPFVI